MRALVLLLVVALASASFAADDAPVQLQPGDPAPVAGVLLPDALAVRRARELVAMRAEVESLKKDAGVPVGLVVLAVALGVVAGGAAGYGVAVATQKR